MSHLEWCVDVIAVLIECDVQASSARVKDRGGLHSSNDVPIQLLEPSAERTRWENLCQRERVRGLHVRSDTLPAEKIALYIAQFIDHSLD